MVIALDKQGEEIFGQKRGGGAASLDMPDGCFFSPSDIMRLTPIQSEKIGLCPEKLDSVRKNRTQSGKVGLSPEKSDSVRKNKTADCHCMQRKNRTRHFAIP